ncbi:MAG TPA: antibiotic biosynthesis monooxygenase family protein [Steroidobacter sp.]
MSDQLTLIAMLRAKPGAEEELGRRLGALVEPTLQEAGCIDYRLHRSNSDSGLWVLYEQEMELHYLHKVGSNVGRA